ncbi:GTPase Era [Candidatus Uhrbacteria bacterium RIFCSPHIGHO2_02_FULL_60_10]|uniref:GTPase Era n=1 Tax=Candidatus Uhrbacteria bacterium RIFCSPHIGHO2_02_FULL_60_10 TaxID=1802392 RepID=A0A1F7U8R2_9BACT|nr:MAG: GTPase Era [Candidatus Uhrbacteria bacterium RIFCSPHIGHO2_02_FULL_60_10]
MSAKKAKAATPELKKSGIVALIGRSNVGKSTLINALVGTKIAIVTPKPQTTRQAIQGVIHDPRGQLVLVDTPGIFLTGRDRLSSKLNETARESVKGVEAVVYVADPTRHVGDEENTVHRLVKSLPGPKFMVLNKSDMDRPFLDEYLAWKDEFNAIFEVSAFENRGLKPLVDALFDCLPTGEPLYPADRITDIDNRFWISEVIREKVFLNTDQEVPYTVRVEVDEPEIRENGMNYIAARVITNHERYKKMLIGTRGMTVKRIGQAARKELEAVTGQKVFLDLQVEVDERWQDRFE